MKSFGLILVLCFIREAEMASLVNLHEAIWGTNIVPQLTRMDIFNCMLVCKGLNRTLRRCVSCAVATSAVTEESWKAMATSDHAALALTMVHQHRVHKTAACKHIVTLPSRLSFT